MNLKREKNENGLEEDKIVIKVETESSTPSEPSRSQMPVPKPSKIKKKCFRSTSKLVSAAKQIAVREMECNRRLHKIRTENLKLEAELLKYKIEYYKKKLAD
ncbi:uncharacterized protein LOC124540144 [Vanessa cardui]|uniref:uncharacterized protein LOC124540144 n=1 Tax=Vanessa cardui TaxID=171605 RepID=UPI001F13ABED|nr:uncharacterized protein LOC124540144 [Vanessa cardui]